MGAAVTESCWLRLGVDGRDRPSCRVRASVSATGIEFPRSQHHAQRRGHHRHHRDGGPLRGFAPPDRSDLRARRRDHCRPGDDVEGCHRACSRGRWRCLDRVESVDRRPRRRRGAVRAADTPRVGGGSCRPARPTCPDRAAGLRRSAAVRRRRSRRRRGRRRRVIIISGCHCTARKRPSEDSRPSTVPSSARGRDAEPGPDLVDGLVVQAVHLDPVAVERVQRRARRHRDGWASSSGGSSKRA